MADLDGPRLEPGTGPARQLVVFLHGYGADGNDLIEIGRAWQGLIPHAALTALHGIGPWSADVYLLFCLGNADAWPAGDLALQEAARIAFGLRRRPDVKAMAKLAEPWRPWRGVAAHLLWAYYRAVKQRDGAPVDVKTILTKTKKLNGARRGR